MSKRGKQKKGAADGKFFQTTKKGEIHELKNDLNSTQKDKVKDAVKKVIAAMTVGKDVSMLFTDVVKSMATPDIELKKLVYLYIINYARSQPDKAILVVNTFQKDAKDPSPLVRALAIRTMGCIRVDKITEYLCEPLKQALKDKDPYVRKTAAVCTAKLYDINAELVEEQDFLERLRDMISDPNPMVVANAVAALAEISEASGRDVFQINEGMLQKLMAALNECTEWGQVFLLDALAQYQPTPAQAESIVERVTPRLQHANSAVAMSAIKIIMKYLDIMKNPQLERQLVTQKLPPPLITLLSEQKPEIQYVALRNINLIVQKRPEVLANKVQHFFCKYNDPIYVKMEKLEIMIKLTDASNVEQVLMEFKEYAQEVDIEFVRRAVRAIGRCAIKLDRAAERCIKVLLELIETKVNYVIQEAIIVIKDIFRKYPNRYESIIATLCENLETLDEPEAKASMIWIIGEYAARIENAGELLESFLDNFREEPAMVQLQLLTAVVKLFLRKPEAAKDMVTRTLNMATDTADNPDLRDRGYVYWRLLSTDPEAAQAVVLADKPPISDDTYQLDPAVLDTLIANISTLSSIYHKPPESFVKGGRTFTFHAVGDEEKESASEEESGSEGASGSEEGEEGEEKEEAEAEEEENKGEAASTPDAEEKVTSSSPPPVVDLLGAFADFGVSSAPASSEPARKQVLAPDKSNGLEVLSCVRRVYGTPTMDMIIRNKSPNTPLSNFAIKFNKNFWGLSPGEPIKLETKPVPPGGETKATMKLSFQGQVEAKAKPRVLQVAVKSELGVAYFQESVDLHTLFTEDGKLSKPEFLSKWKALGEEETEMELSDAKGDLAAVEQKLNANNVFSIAKRGQPGDEHLFMSLRVLGNWPSKQEDVLLELICLGPGQLKACVKCANSDVGKAVLKGVGALVKGA